MTDEEKEQLKAMENSSGFIKLNKYRVSIDLLNFPNNTIKNIRYFCWNGLIDSITHFFNRN